MSDGERLDEMLSRYFEGAASADEVAEIEARLLADDAFAERVSRWCLLHRQVGELLVENALHEMMDRFVQGTPGPPKGMFAATRAAASPRPRERARRRGIAAAAAAALLAVVAALWLRPWSGNLADAPPADGAANLDFVATLTRLVDGVWQGDGPPPQVGDHLAVGSRVALASGLAKVTFECGAEVVLEGPCDFEIRSQMLGFLNSGKMTADVPRRAFGFAILAPGVDFVDLGTSFGVNVGGDGRTELHVFEGEVLCSPTPDEAGDRSDAIHVRAHRAVEFDAARGASDIALDAESFAQLIAMRRPVQDADQVLLPRGLALWLAADAAVAADAQGRVVSWQDLLYGDNVSAEDAIQRDRAARPALVAGAINGRPAVRFDGRSDFLLTTPLETTDDQTVVLVCQFSQSAFDPDRRWGGQILNYDGPVRLPEDLQDPSQAERNRYLSNTFVPGVLQIGEPLLETQFQPTVLSGQVFAGFIGSATIEVGRIDAPPVGADRPFVLSYVYDYGRRRAELRINGRLIGVERAYAPQAITSRKIIGRHAWMQNFFHGDLAELLIYNQAMSPADLAATTAYLADKYAIRLEPENEPPRREASRPRRWSP